MLSPFSGPRRAAPAPALLPALGAGLAAALLAFVWLRQQQPARQEEAPLVPVVVAARAVPARSRLRLADLEVRRLAPAQVPPDGVSLPGDVAGEVTVVPLAAGEPLTRRAVAAPGAALGLAYGLPPGHRAMTVAVDPVSGVAGLLQAGDRVDIVATFEAGGRGVTRTVLQDVLLLALGSSGRPGSGDKPSDASSATVAVRPQAVQVLALAAARGRLQLALRPADETAEVPLPPLGSEALAGNAAPRAAAPKPRPPQTPPPAPKPAARTPKPAAPEKPPALTVTVIRGSVVEKVRVGY